MAKARAICRCQSCGETFYREKTCYNRKDADFWEAWASQTFDECPTCYSERMRKEESEKPLTIEVNVRVYPPQILLTASGNTREHKEALKAAGYRWGYIEEGGLFGMLSMPPRMSWQRTIPLVDKDLDSEKFKNFLVHEFEKIDKLGAVCKMECTQVDLAMCGQQLAKIQKEKAAKQAAIDQLEKPKRPDCLPEGFWNGKIYGFQKTGYAIYVDSTKIPVSEDQKEELLTWIAKKEEFEQKVAKIKNS